MKASNFAVLIYAVFMITYAITFEEKYQLFAVIILASYLVVKSIEKSSFNSKRK